MLLNPPPPLSEGESLNFGFTVSLETRANANNKLVFIIVTIEIKSEEQTHSFCKMAASCVYEVENFNEVIEVSTEGKIEIDKQFNDLFNSVSISTVRGVLFSYLKGTFLHNALLPLVDPTKLQPL